jgi:cytochrome bd ubiquinol oxidase subunit I
MMFAAYLSVAMVVGAVGAFHLLRDRQNQSARTMFSMALWMALITAPLQIAAGDIQGENTLRYQPQKVAAMEGDWRHGAPGAGEPLVLFALPNQQEERNDAEVSIPHIGSLYLTHSWRGTIKALGDFPPQDLPYVPIVFFAFRIMVGLGLLMAAFGVTGAVLRWRGMLFRSRWFQRLAIAMGPAGFTAMLAGWTVTEAGRQPYTVYGLLRTAQSASPIGTPGVAGSLAAFAIIYLIVFGAAILFLLRLFATTPVTNETGVPTTPLRSAGLTPGPAGAVNDQRAPAE